MSFVLDASITLAFMMPDEGTSGPVLDRLMQEGAIVPSLWRLEVANALLVAERRGRIDAAFREEAIADLMVMPVVCDAETDAHAWEGSLDLAFRHRLSTYDAAYLELAKRRAAPLATLDAALARAAEAEGVPVIGRGA